MEIINLKTSIPEEKTELNILKITDIKQAVKNQDRVNIFVNNKYSFSLNIAQVVDFKIKIGRKLTEEELEEMKKASAFGKMYQRTLEWVLMRPRSIRETYDHLKQTTSKNKLKNKIAEEKEYKTRSPELDFETMEEIVNRLIAKGYLNDEKFAEYYVENRFVKKGISKKRLKMELMKKGIDAGIIEKVLESGARNDEDEIKKIIAKKRNKYDDEKLIAYLVRQGFSYDLVKDLVYSCSDSTGA